MEPWINLKGTASSPQAIRYWRIATTCIAYGRSVKQHGRKTAAVWRPRSGPQKSKADSRPSLFVAWIWCCKTADVLAPFLWNQLEKTIITIWLQPCSDETFQQEIQNMISIRWKLTAWKTCFGEPANSNHLRILVLLIHRRWARPYMKHKPWHGCMHETLLLTSRRYTTAAQHMFSATVTSGKNLCQCNKPQEAQRILYI